MTPLQVGLSTSKLPYHMQHSFARAAYLPFSFFFQFLWQGLPNFLVYWYPKYAQRWQSSRDRHPSTSFTTQNKICCGWILVVPSFLRSLFENEHSQDDEPHQIHDEQQQPEGRNLHNDVLRVESHDESHV